MLTASYRVFSGAVMAAVVLVLLTAPASAQQSKRHMVFSYSVGIRNDSRESTSMGNNSGNGGANNGANSYSANASDKGEITVDIMGVQPDGGLVVSTSQTGKTRIQAPTTCVVYPTTNVVCTDANTFPEQLAVLRTLSPKFFNGANLDANRHWRVADSGAAITIDFNVTPESSGMLDIASQRDQTFKGALAGSVHATANYVYNPARYVPASVKEYTIVRQETGPGQYSNITIDVTAQLAKDSAGS